MPIFKCEICNYSTTKFSNLTRHNSSISHCEKHDLYKAENNKIKGPMRSLEQNQEKFQGVSNSISMDQMHVQGSMRSWGPEDIYLIKYMHNVIFNFTLC